MRQRLTAGVGCRDQSSAGGARRCRLPLVCIETQIDVQNSCRQSEGGRAPVDQFARYRHFPDASNKTGGVAAADDEKRPPASPRSTGGCDRLAAPSSGGRI